MRFCEVCQNMMFINNTDSRELRYTCKNCNHQVVDEATVTKFITETIHGNKGRVASTTVDRSIKYDPTLPRTDMIVCPNPECKPERNLVIYVKTNAEQLEFTYFCCHCEKFWTPKK